MMATDHSVELILGDPEKFLYDELFSTVRGKEHQDGIYNLVNVIGSRNSDPSFMIQEIMDKSSKCSYVWKNYQLYPDKMRGLTRDSTIKLHHILTSQPNGEGYITMYEASNFSSLVG